MSKRVSAKEVLHASITWKHLVDKMGGREKLGDPSKVLYDAIEGFQMTAAADRIEKEVFDDVVPE